MQNQFAFVWKGTYMQMKSGGAVVFIFIILAGFVLGGYIGDVLGVYPGFGWLSYGESFGFNAASPLTVDLHALRLVFGLSIRINIASILGVFLSLFLYKLLRK